MLALRHPRNLVRTGLAGLRAVLEAGGHDNYHWIHIPVGYLYLMGNPRADWGFKTAEEPGLNGRSLNYPRGRVLGGCSSINGMIYMRGQAADYDHWRQLGNAGWGWDDVLPLFRRSEDHWEGSNEFHGAGGEWRIEAPRVAWEILDAFRDAAEQCGIPRTEDFNRGDNFGCGYFEVNQKNGWRWNTVKAFLRPICYARPNFEMWTSAQAAQLIIETLPDGSRRCTGVKVWDGHEMVTAHAAREVVLSAGAVNSPQLLQLSGIGPAALLGMNPTDIGAAAPAQRLAEIAIHPPNTALPAGLLLLHSAQVAAKEVKVGLHKRRRQIRCPTAHRMPAQIAGRVAAQVQNHIVNAALGDAH